MILLQTSRFWKGAVYQAKDNPLQLCARDCLETRLGEKPTEGILLIIVGFAFHLFKRPVGCAKAQIGA